jgi:hypothetical protein
MVQMMQQQQQNQQQQYQQNQQMMMMLMTSMAGSRGGSRGGAMGGGAFPGFDSTSTGGGGSMGEGGALEQVAPPDDLQDDEGNGFVQVNKKHMSSGAGGFNCEQGSVFPILKKKTTHYKVRSAPDKEAYVKIKHCQVWVPPAAASDDGPGPSSSEDDPSESDEAS